MKYTGQCFNDFNNVIYGYLREDRLVGVVAQPAQEVARHLRAPTHTRARSVTVAELAQTLCQLQAVNRDLLSNLGVICNF